MFTGILSDPDKILKNSNCEIGLKNPKICLPRLSSSCLHRPLHSAKLDQHRLLKLLQMTCGMRKEVSHSSSLASCICMFKFSSSSDVCNKPNCWKLRPRHLASGAASSARLIITSLRAIDAKNYMWSLFSTSFRPCRYGYISTCKSVQRPHCTGTRQAT